MKKIISDRSKSALNSLPLIEVMEKSGHRPLRKTEREAYYKCPFHSDSHPSLGILYRPSDYGRLSSWNCLGCHRGGEGALSLEAALAGMDIHQDFPEVCKSLARKFNLSLEYADSTDGSITYDYPNGFFHRAKKVSNACSRDIHFNFHDIEWSDCESLGCRRRVIVREMSDEVSGIECSWGSGFHPSRLQEDFSLYSVDSMILPYHQDETDGKSWRVSSAPFYPILSFRYIDRDSNVYWKLYEPLCRNDIPGVPARSKFYYYPDRHDKPYDMRGELWGDCEFMEAWRSGQVKKSESPSDDMLDTPGMLPHPSVRVSVSGGKDEEEEKVWKFERLLICSGPKDGINAYYYSTAHVCWPLSESMPLTTPMLQRLRKIAKENFICYDIDSSGISGMHQVALQHLDIRVVYLPKELRDIKNPVSRKPCKDLTEWFCYYPLRPGESRRYAFEGLLRNSIPMCFWKIVGARRNMGGYREQDLKYEMLIDSVAQYAHARGFYLYQPKLYGEDGQLGRFYFKVEDNISKTIEDKDVVQEIKHDMLDYLSRHYIHNNQSLRNAVITSRKLIPDNLFALATSNTTFISWGSDYCYFFFRNTAVKVTADAMTPVPYPQLPFYVNRRSIINFDFDWRGEEFFDIEYNNADLRRIQESKDRRFNELRNQGMLTAQNEKIENERYSRIERLWRYKLLLKKKMNDLPPSFQVVYDTGRIYWEKERQGLSLTREEKQRQDMYFISKCLSIGYMLHPFRDPTRIYAVVSTDYNDQSGKAQGRNMKSFIGGQLLPLVRKGLMIGGKSINTKPDKFAENFANYELTEHSYMYLDDLKTELDVEVLFNSGNMISKRKLYHDAVQIQGQWVPKIMMSTNNPRVFDLSSSSQFERIWMQPHSDYYHAEDERGQRSAYNPMTKFGRNIIEDMTDDERQETTWWLLKCCQLYIRENRDHFDSVIVRVDPDDAKRMERLEDLIRDRDMVLFLQDFFSRDKNYNRPIARKEMMLQYELFKLCKNEGIELDHVIGVKKESLSTAQVTRFGRCVKSYCENLPYEQRIIVNPESLFGSEQRWKSEGVVSRQAWVSPLDDSYSENLSGYNPNLPREKRSERCYYFFKIKDVPQDKEHVLGCGELDTLK